MNVVISSTIKSMSPQLIVTDLDNSVEFYKKMLGFNISFRYEDFYAGIIKDGFYVHFKSGKPSVEERKNKRNNEDLDIIFSVDHKQGFCRTIQG
ncbi:MAG: VOC family protein [Bacteroidetes bacterium]|nr:VOC family protein [Bacteroidota bacterium]MBS1934794.1 VOC family protein [Bacteroidota bacterium]